MAKRGHIEKPENRPATPGRGYARVGNGPPCPTESSHGNLLSWDSEKYPWMCPHVGHGLPTSRHGPFFRANEV